MFEALRNVRAWQAGLVVLVIIATLGATYGGYLLTTRDGDDDLGEDQQLIPVQRGDLINEVSVSGSLMFPNREILRFGAAGVVGRVLVEEGQQIGAGDPLAALDEETITGLEKSVAQARVGLRDAEDALDDLMSPVTALDLAQANAAVADARLAHTAALDSLATLRESDPRAIAQGELAVSSATVALEDSRESLQTLLDSPTAEEMARAEAAVAGARLSVERSKDSLDVLQSPGAEDLARAQTAVADARLSLREAEDALTVLLAPTSQLLADAEAGVIRSRLAADIAAEALQALNERPDADETALARSQIDSAETALVEAKLDLALATKQWEGRVDDAAYTLEALVDEYRGVFREWLGAELTDDVLLSVPASILGSWGADLITLFGPDTRFSDLLQIYSIAGFQDDPATRWDEGIVSVWVNFYPGPISTV
jgi:hypothetical protein